MDRRGFMGCGLVGALGMTGSGRTRSHVSIRSKGSSDSAVATSFDADRFRKIFPRLRNEIFLNAAGGMPQAVFAQQSAHQFNEFWRLGPGDGRGKTFQLVQRDTRELFAKLIGAAPEEIAFVQNTKAGEQIVIDAMPSIRVGGNIVTNDLHFTGSLHNLIGLGKSGVDVRIVKSNDWKTDIQAMTKRIDNKTSLVCISLVSNINGHVEPIQELAECAHRHEAKIYADIIQAAGIVPLSVRQLGIDFAACSGYKWLYGTHGAGFLYVAREHQGTVLEDRVFPGHTRHKYSPWTENPLADGEEEFDYDAPKDATRYQTGHVSYYGYAVLNAGLRFIESIGVEKLLDHSCKLNARLLGKIDSTKYKSISPGSEDTPILTLTADNIVDLPEKLAAERIVVGLSENRIRVSPAIFNNEDDIDRLARLLNRL